MTFRLPDAWIWDFWFAKDGATYHMFYLRADRSLGNPDLRHRHAVIGHAASQDLITWHDLGPCLPAARHPSWDDGPTWTGSIIRRDGVWHMFFTGTSIAEDCKKQRIGLATSKDLHHWDRYSGNPILDIDPYAYEEYEPTIWHDRAWRDPYVVPDPIGEGYRMFFTARVNSGSEAGRGVIAQARSSNLTAWHLIPAATEPGSFGQLEVPQFVKLGRQFYLLFSTSSEHMDPVVRDQLAPGEHRIDGTHYFMADHPNGPWRLADGPLLADGQDGGLYSGKIVHGPTGAPLFMAFRDTGADGAFIGEVSDPIPLGIEPDGRLRLACEGRNPCETAS